MPHFFISYRTNDLLGRSLAHMVFRELKRRFGEESVFFAIDSKSPGLSFPKKVEQALRITDAVLVIIGPDWLRLLNERQEDARDWVRYEIAESLRRPSLPVVPVCAAGVEMPRPDQLPEDVSDLGLRDSVTLDPFQDFDSHLTRLLGNLERILARVEGERQELRLAREKLTALLKWRAGELERTAAHAKGESPAVQGAAFANPPQQPAERKVQEQALAERRAVKGVETSIPELAAGSTPSSPPPRRLRSGNAPLLSALKILAGLALIVSLGIFGYRQMFPPKPPAPAAQPTGNNSLPAAQSSTDASNSSPQGGMPGNGQPEPGANPPDPSANNQDGEVSKKQRAQLAAQLPLLRTLRERQEIGAHLLASVSADVPPDLWLDTLDFDEKSVQLTGGALTEQSIRSYGESLTQSSRFTEGRLTTAKSDLWTSYTIPLDCRPNYYGTPDTDLYSSLWKDTPPDDLERELRNLIDGKEVFFQQPRKPAQKGLFELISLSTRLDNISYTSLVLSLDRMARSPRLIGLQQLKIHVTNPSDRTLTVDLALEVPVLKRGVQISTGTGQSEEGRSSETSSIVDPFRSVARPSEASSLSLDGFKKQLIDINNKIFPGHYSAVVNINGYEMAFDPGDHLVDAEIIAVRPDAVTLKRYFSKTPVSPRETETVVVPRPKN
jgi:hypothetical protein